MEHRNQAPAVIQPDSAATAALLFARSSLYTGRGHDFFNHAAGGQVDEMQASTVGLVLLKQRGRRYGRNFIFRQKPIG